MMYPVYMETLFSSIKLFSRLRDKDIGAVETVRSNSGGFPRVLALRGKQIKTWDSLASVVCAIVAFLLLPGLAMSPYRCSLRLSRLMIITELNECRSKHDKHLQIDPGFGLC